MSFGSKYVRLEFPQRNENIEGQQHAYHVKGVKAGERSSDSCGGFFFQVPLDLAGPGQDFLHLLRPDQLVRDRRGFDGFAFFDQKPRLPQLSDNTCGECDAGP